jgi:hypothetical protein
MAFDAPARPLLAFSREEHYLLPKQADLEQ